jgi:hypothetical protein
MRHITHQISLTLLMHSLLPALASHACRVSSKYAYQRTPLDSFFSPTQFYLTPMIQMIRNLFIYSIHYLLYNIDFGSFFELLLSVTQRVCSHANKISKFTSLDRELHTAFYRTSYY